MKIQVNDKSEIISYTIVGTFKNGIEIDIPKAVVNDNPLTYKYENGEFIKLPEIIHPPSTSIDDIVSALVDLDLQREQDKLELHLAISELAEILFGGDIDG